MQLAISEALVGLIDQAKARIDKAEEDGILGDNTIDDRTGGGGDHQGCRGRARAAAEGARGAEEERAARRQAAEGERAIRGAGELAEGKPAEAVSAARTGVLRRARTPTS